MVPVGAQDRRYRGVYPHLGCSCDRCLSGNCLPATGEKSSVLTEVLQLLLVLFPACVSANIIKSFAEHSSVFRRVQRKESAERELLPLSHSEFPSPAPCLSPSLYLALLGCDALLGEA